MSQKDRDRLVACMGATMKSKLERHADRGDNWREEDPAWLDGRIRQEYAEWSKALRTLDALMSDPKTPPADLLRALADAEGEAADVANMMAMRIDQARGELVGTAPVAPPALTYATGAVLHSAATPSNGTSTSGAAAKSVRKSAVSLLNDVLAAARAAGAKGVTIDETEIALDRSHQAVCPRFWDLVKRGAIRKTDATRPTRTGRKAVVYVAT